MAKRSPQEPSVSGELAAAGRRIERAERTGDDPFFPNGNDKLKLVEEREIADMRQALNSPFIRRVLWRIDKLAETLGPSFDKDPYVMAHNEGVRAIGLAIRRAVTAADPYAYHQMEREAISNEKSQQEENDAS